MTASAADTAIWFDAEHTHAAAGVHLLTPDRRVILQLRDDIPNIDNPGRITAFAGGAERHETPLQCAIRELAEETGVVTTPDRLRFVGARSARDFRGNRIACVFYLLEGVEPDALVVTEGRAVVMTFDALAADPRLTESCRAMCARIQQMI